MEEDFGPGTKLLGVADWFQKKLGQSSAQPGGDSEGSSELWIVRAHEKKKCLLEN
jgi:hypothetical protein